MIDTETERAFNCVVFTKPQRCCCRGVCTIWMPKRRPVEELHKGSGLVREKSFYSPEFKKVSFTPMPYTNDISKILRYSSDVRAVLTSNSVKDLKDR